MNAGARSTQKPIGRYRLVPITLLDGQLAEVLIDTNGRVVTRPKLVDVHGDLQDFPGDHYGNLHTQHADGLESITVTSPGVAYVNGTNALCLAAPVDEDHEIEIEGVYLSAKAAGDFYLVVANLGITPGATTTNTFDLVGLYGDGVTQTCDVLWAAFLANNQRGGTGGLFHQDGGAGAELYLIAPDVTYSLAIQFINEF